MRKHLPYHDNNRVFSLLKHTLSHFVPYRKRIVCAAMDARCRQVYTALFACENGRVSRLTPDEALSLDDLEKHLLSTKKSIFLVGDGAELCYNTFGNHMPGGRPRSPPSALSAGGRRSGGGGGRAGTGCVRGTAAAGIFASSSGGAGASRPAGAGAGIESVRKKGAWPGSGSPLKKERNGEHGETVYCRPSADSA